MSSVFNLDKHFIGGLAGGVTGTVAAYPLDTVCSKEYSQSFGPILFFLNLTF